jgi:hypothetical protein
MISAPDCLRLTEIFIGVAVILQTIELLSIREAFSERGVWRWSMLKNLFPRGMGAIVSPFLCDRGFLIVLSLSLLAAVFSIFSGQWILSLVLVVTTFLISLRWLGTFNGGSDYMTFLILYSITIARYFGNERILKGALLYIAIQTCLSYFVAGIVKLKNADWRSGKALVSFLTESHYEVPARVKRWAQDPNYFWLFRWVSWKVIAFECVFPLALYGPKTCAWFIFSACLFHLSTFYVFGLNRFFFAWVAAYPALFYWSQISLHP